MFDPSLGGGVLLLQGTDLTFGTDDNSVRYGDDAGESSQLTWDDVKAAHADERVIMVGVSQGTDGAPTCRPCSRRPRSTASRSSSTPLRRTAATARNGSNGADGTNGVDGKNGATTARANGKDGVTTIIHQYGTGSKLLGASMRTLRAPLPKGAKLVSVKATLRNKALPVSGRTVKVNLAGKAVGNYNVSMLVKYKKGGKTHTARSTRSLSVTLAA